jgi:chaperone required for assembly of F1-ATPase
MVSMSSAKPERRALPQRFYQQVSLEPHDNGFVILLDGKRIRTPAKNILHVLLHQIAAAIVVEWDAQTEVIDPDLMPLTRLVHIAIDRVPVDRALLLEDIGRYIETDLLCYRVPVVAGGHPLAADNRLLRAQQDAAFDPILAWMRQTYAAAFVVTEEILPVQQSVQAMAAITAVYAAADDYALAALAMMVPLLGSALLALAVWQGYVPVEQALSIARLDENAQAEQWGVDAEVARAWESKARDIRACAFFLTCK